MRCTFFAVVVKISALVHPPQLVFLYPSARLNYRKQGVGVCYLETLYQNEEHAMCTLALQNYIIEQDGR